MKIKILSPQWGHEHLDMATFLAKIRNAGYDGVDTWIPLDPADKKILFGWLQEYGMYMVSHQHRAQGSTFEKYKAAFLKDLPAGTITP